jgi:hypothetical protein
MSSYYKEALTRIGHAWPARLNRRELLAADAVVALPSWTHSDHLIRQRDMALDFGKRVFYVKTLDDMKGVETWARQTSGD